jgi:hypothetical protein
MRWCGLFGGSGAVVFLCESQSCWYGKGARSIHIILEDVSCGTAGEVVCGDLDHDLVKILDDIFELACNSSALW